MMVTPQKTTNQQPAQSHLNFTEKSNTITWRKKEKETKLHSQTIERTQHVQERGAKCLPRRRIHTQSESDLVGSGCLCMEESAPFHP